MLSSLLTEYGADLSEDPRRLEALLKDLLSNDFKRQIFLLVVSAREGIARDLLSPNAGLPSALLGSRLVARLCDNLALDEAAARWAVETWAEALKVPNPLPHSTLQNTSLKPAGNTDLAGVPKKHRSKPSVGLDRTMKAFESAIAAIRAGGSTRVFLMSCDASDFGQWEADAKVGVAEAQWLMGDCYLEGIAGRFDDKAARQWFQAASDSGLVWGTMTLARMHIDGIGGEMDIATGVNLLRKACSMGEPEAMFRLALYGLKHEGKSGKAKAVQLLRDAANAAYPGAMYVLGKLILEEALQGDSVPQEAIRLIEEAAKQGHVRAVVCLAELLLGDATQRIVQNDSTRAMQLLREAANAGNNSAITILERHGINQHRKVQETSIGATMVHIHAGRFIMGSWAGELTFEQQYHDESPPHSVLIARDFYLSKTVVTQSQYRQVIGKNPSKHKWSLFDRGQRPVERVTWHDAIRFCNALSIREGLPCYYSIDGNGVRAVGGIGYRLPTEAEWEYACRADSLTHWSWGSDEGSAKRFGAMAIDIIEASTRIVGRYACNDYGLYDMHGGVWEWCWDYYSEDFYSESPAINPVGPATGTKRVARGGSYWEPTMNCRSAMRAGYDPEKRDQDLGFRIARFSGP